MKQNSDILEKIDRRSGMTVPEGYFADFASRMQAQLPEQEAATEAKIVKPGAWQRFRPYIYMAAMFCGVWLMMWIFNDISKKTSQSMIDNPVIAKVLESDKFYDYYAIDEVDDYTMLQDMYDDGVTLANFAQN
jgi:hypothetical protein